MPTQPPGASSQNLDIENLSDTTRLAYEYWIEARGKREIPLIDTLDPLKIPRRILANFTVVEVLMPGPRFLVRLTGSAVRDAAGQDYTGRMVHQMPGAEEVVERFTWCVTHGRPYSKRAALTWSSNDFRNYEALVLPFVDSKGRVAKLASVIHIL